MKTDTGRVMRLDQALMAQEFAPSRARAAQLIIAGVVRVNGVAAGKASQKISSDDRISLTDNPIPWVSRAALKLVHALDYFALTPSGIVLDLGASTGGFTQVMLDRGADQVIALDVGKGQLHPSIDSDPRVRRMDGVNAKDITTDLLPPLDWIVTDVSFISLEKALPAALGCAKSGAQLVALIKPQFEAGRGAVGKGGIVKDPNLHREIRARIACFLTQSGWQVTHEDRSPITGSDGNQEFLIAARKG